MVRLSTGPLSSNEPIRMLRVCPTIAAWSPSRHRVIFHLVNFPYFTSNSTTLIYKRTTIPYEAAIVQGNESAISTPSRQHQTLTWPPHPPPSPESPSPPIPPFP
ncbi:hypothetical protein K439DRAFT_1642624 [Ramaria rubella]|nr:hypothetical protein K439DRAFT_1642624 [Ramaria rubella]